MPITMNLIINADDFGYSHERNVGIVECFTSGCISSASLLVNGVAAQEAVEMSKECGMTIGLHLNLTEGIPVLLRRHRTLVGSDGSFLGKIGFRESCKNGKINEDEIINEIVAQLKKFEDLTGFLPRHVDGHQHVHVVPNVCSLFANVISKFGAQTTRSSLDYDIKINSHCPSEFLFEVVQHAADANTIFGRFGIRRTDTFFGMTLMGSAYSSKEVTKLVSDMILLKTDKSVLGQNSKLAIESEENEDIARATCEWMVHPGYITGELGGCGDGPDPFSQSPDRQYEMSVLCDTILRLFFHENKIKLVKYNDI